MEKETMWKFVVEFQLSEGTWQFVQEFSSRDYAAEFIVNEGYADIAYRIVTTVIEYF